MKGALNELPRLSATSLSQYVRLENCERFLRFRLRPDEEKAMLERWGLTIQPLTPLLKEAGAEFEREVAEQVAVRGEDVVPLEGEDVEATLEQLRRARRPTILLQPALEAPLGRYLCKGRADAVRLQRDRKNRLQVLVADVKASRRERMEHRLQVATYARMIESLAGENGVPLGAVEGSVLHIQEDGSIPALDPDEPSFDLDSYRTIVERLVTDPDSVVNRILELPFEEVSYHLGYKCDGCLYNAICMYDTAERLDLSLVPYMSAVEKRVLRGAGFETVPELASLMILPERGSGERELKVAPGQEETVGGLANEWPVGANLPLLVQRARQAWRNFDKTVEAAPFIYGGGYGTLPDDEEHPDLVKVFFDAQRDYLQDRAYLISTLVAGPEGERVLVRCTDGPPTEESERALLIGWVTDVITAMREVAAGDRAPIHFYCYNRYDQRVLLEALKRHLEQVAALPAFFDLMTQSPAVEQPILSFLSSELEERRNLGLVCTPLHDAARRLGFDWQDERYAYYQLFRARLFDNRRTVVRKPDGWLVRLAADGPADEAHQVTIEAASRFNSQIPLEYVYAAWDRLPEDADDPHLLTPFRRVSLEQLEAFAAHRVRALAYIEDWFKYKARFLDKPKLHLPSLAVLPTEDPPLSRSLEEFLFMEHYTALQDKLLTYGMSIDRRAQTGLALLLRYEGHDLPDNLYRFVIDFDGMGLDPTLTMNAFRLKEGGWVVINDADPNLSASKIKHGRLGIIQDVGPDWIEIDLLPISFGQSSRFRYWHRSGLKPDPGQHYTLDEMADDMNADKMLEALHNAESNLLYQSLCEKPDERILEEAAFYTRFADLIDQLEGKKKLTARQREVVAARLEDPLFLVQGPPGTGKSHTLSWAVLARIAARAAQGRPYRVAVSSKTHNAVNIVVGTVAAKLQRMMGFPTPMTRALRNLQVYKIVNDESDEVPPNVRHLVLYGYGGQRLENLLQQNLLVMGGTPGGMYNLAKYRAAGGSRSVDWELKTFDLLVMDEASQMSLPEGVLSGAFLKADGHAIVVGDHRQMPPIIAHDWEDEEKRTVADSRPYLSLFESLIERDFPCVALDESFRLHETLADFLQRNIYFRDGMHFFSRRKEVLPPPPETEPFVDLALDPDYPIVVVEHGEQRSQQYNETELALITPLIDVCANRLQLDGMDGIGVVVPHRAQKAILRERFPDLAVTDSIDTVERFQGGERDVIIVSATASDPDYVLAEADFLLDLNRLNVALSRPRKKLIVVASRSVIELLVSDLDIFDNAVIWKRLYYNWARDVLWEGERCGVRVCLRGRDA